MTYNIVMRPDVESHNIRVVSHLHGSVALYPPKFRFFNTFATASPGKLHNSRKLNYYLLQSSTFTSWWLNTCLLKLARQGTILDLHKLHNVSELLLRQEICRGSPRKWKISPSCVAWQTSRTSIKATAHKRKKYLIIFPMLSVCNKLPAQAHQNHHVCWWFSTNKLTHTAVGWMIEVSHIEVMTPGELEVENVFSILCWWSKPHEMTSNYSSVTS